VKEILSVIEMEKGIVNLRRRMICYLLSMLKRHNPDCEKCTPVKDAGERTCASGFKTYSENGHQNGPRRSINDMGISRTNFR
jgi:hypothetical protein